ncbi:LbetaH domain-containing protein [Mastigocoleus testarum]|uniref:Transferase n=1 Tax=Mastigocoleus testarum BC008 TaxID=371196 RepID=A0A0V7ZQR7_9CYAN|nr:hypothetical protein [Mastigocoleus testarum]KST66981.1 hypothetical protein BC008_27720 [Mastigocoleus testarum BC008]KST67130.1 hypothetical protein BC008_28460 [Mastigocoleus testarum BC008]
MSVPPLRLGNQFDIHISGEVSIHQTAVIAPGVILQAAPNSKIIIAAGVCIGMGSILQAARGMIVIGAGANLGAGFLMVGAGTIGENACVGAASTVFNSSVAPGEIVAPGSILGVPNPIKEIPSPEVNSNTQQLNSTTNPESVSSPSGNTESMNGRVNTKNPGENLSSQFPETSQQKELKTPSPEENQLGGNEPDKTEQSSSSSQSNAPATESPSNFGAHIYGQTNINRLLITLFPHRQPLNQPESEDSPE